MYKDVLRICLHVVSSWVEGTNSRQLLSHCFFLHIETYSVFYCNHSQNTSSQKTKQTTTKKKPRTCSADCCLCCCWAVSSTSQKCFSSSSTVEKTWKLWQATRTDGSDLSSWHLWEWAGVCVYRRPEEHYKLVVLPLIHSQPPTPSNAEAASVPLEESVNFSPKMTPVHYLED